MTYKSHTPLLPLLRFGSVLESLVPPGRFVARCEEECSFHFDLTVFGSTKCQSQKKLKQIKEFS